MDLDSSLSRTTGWNFSNAGRVKTGDWGLRQSKRFRDNRPDEHVIHGTQDFPSEQGRDEDTFTKRLVENTVNKLFTAQRTKPHAEPILSASLPGQHAPAVLKPQRSTLHAFWNISAPPVQSLTFPVRQAHVPCCDDCESPLERDASDMDVDMGIDGPDTNPFACNSCGRTVCGKCAVVSDARHCLQCA